jgi:phytoene synthase
VAPDAAYDACLRLARTHYENFPVASRLLPARMRPHVAAVYAYARLADDIADEGDTPLEVRHARLDEWLARLDAAVSGSAFAGATCLDARTAAAAPAVFAALGETIRAHALPASLFADLVSAFRQDTTVTRYATWTDLFDYCRRSANPVGRLVLRLSGRSDPALDRASDAVCTALQLTNFWQDLAIDWRKGRLYVPAEEHVRAGADPAVLDTGRLTAEWAAALRACAARTRALFEAGRAVCDGVRGRLRWELRLTWLGGQRILERLERTGFDVFSARPALAAADAPVLLWRAATWR